jgi:poly-gamma-glutamate synthesis protein (capsule biosynthesis protein)
MSPKKEYLLIFLFSLGISLISYWAAHSYLNNKKGEENTNIKIPQTKIGIESKPQTLSLLFVGDIMLDRTIRKDGETYGYKNLFACLQDTFAPYDEVIGNLEGTVTNFTSVSKNAAYESPESFRFTFDKDAVVELVTLGLSIVSLANNHIRDFGDAGIAQTIQNTQELNLLTFGDPRPQKQRYLIKEINNTKIAFIPYNQFFGTKEQVYEDLKNTKDISDLQIIFAHWGDEYVPVRSDIRALTYAFVDAGADLVIGAHPHVIQEQEVYEDVKIYYSLGNFIFDQYWEEAVRTGLGVSVTIQDKKITDFEEIYFESNRRAGTCEKVPTLQK